MSTNNMSFEQLLKEATLEREAVCRGEDPAHINSSNDNFNDNTNLIDAEDCNILMHKDAHFSGSFEQMIDYYNNDGVGIDPEINLQRITELQQIEQAYSENLSAQYLGPMEIEYIAKSKKSYKGLRCIYEQATKTSQVVNPSKLIADLLLSEDEHPENEIEQIVQHSQFTEHLLIQLLKSDEFLSPYFPAYGRGPLLAARCLGKIHSQESLIALFEALQSNHPDLEDETLKALNNMGSYTHPHLIKCLHSRPLSKDNERAAVALSYQAPTNTIAKACLKELYEQDVLKHDTLTTYLLCACEGLTEKDDQDHYLQLSQHPLFPKDLLPDLKAIANSWKK